MRSNTQPWLMLALGVAIIDFTDLTAGAGLNLDAAPAGRASLYAHAAQSGRRNQRQALLSDEPSQH